MLNCRSRNLSVEPRHNLHRSADKKKKEEAMPYREAVGSLRYLTVASTMPDISFAEGQVLRGSRDKSLGAVKQILSYLCVTRQLFWSRDR